MGAGVTWMVMLIGGLVFLSIAFGAMAFVLEAQTKRMSGQFAQIARGVVNEDDHEQVRGSFYQRVIAPLVARFTTAVQRMTPKASSQAIALRLERSGRPWGLNPGMWTVVRMVVAVGAAAGALATLKFAPIIPAYRLCAAMFVLVFGVIGPGYVLDVKTKQRQSKIRRALPDVIDLLVVSVEAGLGLDASVQEVIARRRGPLLDELARVLAEIRVGKSRRGAWQEMAARVDILELKVFVAALVQAEELGASIAGVMQGQAEALRVRRSLSVRELAAMLPVKMLFPLVFFIFPGVFVVILGPGVISIMETFTRIGF